MNMMNELGFGVLIFEENWITGSPSNSKTPYTLVFVHINFSMVGTAAQVLDRRPLVYETNIPKYGLNVPLFASS
jgi:hypothetical protein